MVCSKNGRILLKIEARQLGGASKIEIEDRKFVKSTLSGLNELFGVDFYPIKRMFSILILGINLN